MSLKQIDLLLYVWLLINAIGWVWVPCTSATSKIAFM